MFNNLFDFINLQNGEEDKKKVLANVKSGISFRGSNLWILACAIVIASVGLNVNSTAVIIGAMLISPLMGPIVGAGFALGTYDFALLKKSGKNLFIATTVSLLIACAYFFISPFKDTQSELLARTTPNIYDVLIAFFGGLVGVIAITRVEKGNPIPGVAIATALMPPLCTAGYGLAIGNFQFFLGAFFLYTINCFFICIATFFIVKYLKYPPVSTVNAKLDKQIRYGISTLIFVMIVPSFYLAYNLFNEKKYSQKVDQFIADEFSNNGYTIIYQKTKFNQSPKEIQLAFLTKKFTDEEIKQLNKKLKTYELENTVLEIKQNNTDIKGEILQEINGNNKKMSQKEIQIAGLRAELSKFKIEDENLYSEIKILFPELKDFSIGTHLSRQQDSVKTITVLLYEKDLKNSLDKNKLKLWLQHKLNRKDVELISKN